MSTTIFIENTHDEHAYKRADTLVQAGEAEGPVTVNDSQLFRCRACKAFDVYTESEVRNKKKAEIVDLAQRLGVENATTDKTKDDLLELIGLV